MNELTIQKKATEVSEISKIMSDSASFVICGYSGLTVTEMTDLRKKLAESDCEMKVLKNNITRRAAKEAGHDMDTALVGANAITFSKTDSVAAAKILYEYSKENDKLELKVGVIDGNFVDNKELMVYANIPSREVLLGMLAGGLISPIREMAIALDLIVKQKEELA